MDVRTILKKNKVADVKGCHKVQKEDDRTLRRKWLQGMMLDPPYPENPENFVLCELHFTDDNFKRELQFEISGHGKQRFKLIDGAVPSVFSFSAPIKKRSFAESRSKAWVNKRLILDAVQPTSSFPASDEDIVSIPDLTESAMSSQTLVESKSNQIYLIFFIICDNYYESQDSNVDEVITEDEPFENAEMSRKYFLVNIEKLKALFEHCFICGNSSLRS